MSNEAAVRCTGWLLEAPSSGAVRERTGDLATTFSPESTGALRASGAMGLLSPWKVRRGGRHRRPAAMRYLSPRRFPEVVTRIRSAPPVYDDASGDYLPGPVTETTLRASVQPVDLLDVPGEDGLQLTERLTVYVPQSGALLGAQDWAVADRIRYGGAVYEVQRSVSWPVRYTRADVIPAP